uniref:Uncharacterized protein n=1 Tax=Chromera velia CCMP2878 TaxID=1169474 RepID=A0A0G4FAA0_9ALVE|eukprot:Cvel_15867.t1-p1 / transcript=Cvel_15867.t1 / gene=Cvel_15867 / organism=Chromera_velia_CCMP2878 / gene_product=hypothetical protein / transcript_product=hypothetical protein / location=Cvel_scaffold1196:47782-48489(-) / protein_length=236 / sequence_SO=supercontig / SO=protein_coding / is_pseudo=false
MGNRCHKGTGGPETLPEVRGGVEAPGHPPEYTGAVPSGEVDVQGGEPTAGAAAAEGSPVNIQSAAKELSKTAPAAVRGSKSKFRATIAASPDDIASKVFEGEGEGGANVSRPVPVIGFARSGTQDSLDPTAAENLRSFIHRNVRAQRQQTQEFAQLEKENPDVNSTAGTSEKIAAYDVFSPDVRSVRWAELQEALSSDQGEAFSKFKEGQVLTRGAKKALTVAAQKPGEGGLPTLH